MRTASTRGMLREHRHVLDHDDRGSTTSAYDAAELCCCCEQNRAGMPVYLIKYKGYPLTDEDWLPVTQIDAPQLIEEFEALQTQPPRRK